MSSFLRRTHRPRQHMRCPRLLRSPQETRDTRLDLAGSDHVRIESGKTDDISIVASMCRRRKGCKKASRPCACLCVHITHHGTKSEVRGTWDEYRRLETRDLVLRDSGHSSSASGRRLPSGFTYDGTGRTRDVLHHADPNDYGRT